jgi:hypothetical protein
MTEFMVFDRILTIMIVFTLLGQLVPLQMARGHKKTTLKPLWPKSKRPIWTSIGVRNLKQRQPLEMIFLVP